MKTITATYDVKRILLGENISGKEIGTYYDEDKPVLNILRAYNTQLYKDTSKDYVQSGKRGHVEYYQSVQDIFGVVYGCAVDVPKDIMHSFWHTYKFALQFYYPDYFRPNDDKLTTSKPLSNSFITPPISKKIPPHKNGTLGDEYETYYKNSNFEFKDAAANVDWITFLIENYDRFERVHDNPQFQEFARLTHTIGNVTIVPKGFNTTRGTYAYDYWDYALASLKDSLSTIDGKLWRNYVTAYHYEEYVDTTTDYAVLPLWPNHLTNQHFKTRYDADQLLIPQNEKQIQTFLETVNKKIKNRGERILEMYTKAK